MIAMFILVACLALILGGLMVYLLYAKPNIARLNQLISIIQANEEHRNNIKIGCDIQPLRESLDKVISDLLALIDKMEGKESIEQVLPIDLEYLVIPHIKTLEEINK